MAFEHRINAKRFLNLFSLIRPAFAEEPPAEGEEESGAAPIINYEDLISRARKEEKDKLYPKIQSLETKVTEQINTINAHLLTIGAKDSEITELKQKLTSIGGNDTETVKALKEQIKALENELAESKKNTKPVDEELLRATIRTEVETEFNVKLYRLEKLREAGDEILTPELVIGTTNEEIDKSIEDQKAKTLEIKKKLGLVDDEGNPVDKTPKKPKPTPNNPPKDKGQQTIDFEYLASLDPASPEYEEARKKLGLR